MHKDMDPFAEFDSKNTDNDDNKGRGVEVTLLFKSGAEDTFYLGCYVEDFLYMWAKKKSPLLLYNSEDNEYTFVDKREVVMMRCKPSS